MSPTVFREKGYRFYFLTNEENRIHIHVTSEDGEAKFWLQPEIALATNHQFRPNQLNQIQKLIEEHRDEIVSTWEQYFG